MTIVPVFSRAVVLFGVGGSILIKFPLRCVHA